MLITLSEQKGCDFGKHIIHYYHECGDRVFAYEYNGYWKDIGTLGAYWESNMELIDLIPVFNLYEEFWKIYTKSDTILPQDITVVSKQLKEGEDASRFGIINTNEDGRIAGFEEKPL